MAVPSSFVRSLVWNVFMLCSKVGRVLACWRSFKLQFARDALGAELATLAARRYSEEHDQLNDR